MEIQRRIAQLLLLFKKNWILQRRKPLVTLIELIIPALLAVIVVLIRGNVHNIPKPNPKTWPAFEVKNFPLLRSGSKWLFFPPCKLGYYPDTSWAKEIMSNFKIERELSHNGISGFVIT